MVTRILKYSNILAEFAHQKLFGKKIGTEMGLFLRNLSWSFFGGIFSSAVMFTINILAGRQLGPHDFGQYNALVSVAMSLSVFILLGNDSSSVRYIADSDYKKRENNIFSASFWLTIIQFIIVLIAITVFKGELEKYLGIAFWPLLITVLFSITVAFKNLIDSYLRAFYFIKLQSFVRIISSLFSLFPFIVFFYFFKTNNYHDLILALVIGNVLFVIIGLSFFLKNFSTFNLKDVQLLFNYNKFLIIGTIALSLLTLEHYLIGKFIGASELGIYSAYAYGSFLVISHLAVYFNNIFWPAAIKNKNELPKIIQKIKVLTLVALPLWLLSDLVFLFMILFLFGKNYPIRIDYLILFPLAAFCLGLYLIFMHLLYIDKIKTSSLISLATGVLLIAFLAIFKNLTLYLIFQIFLYAGFSLFIAKYVNNGFNKKLSKEKISTL